MRLALLLSLSVICAFSQDAKPPEPQAAAEQKPVVEKVPSEKAPPEVDAALRARVKQFYQAHVDAKYRIADQVVAEDSKDLFFAATKPKYEGFEIVRINYYEDFTKADAVVATKGTWYFRGEKMPVTMPITSTWKLEDGKWCWYVVPMKEAATPFGVMHFDSGKEGQSGGAVPALPADPKVLAQQILSQVRLDKSDVQLSSFEPSTAEVRIQNGMAGSITIRADLDGSFPGLRLELDKTQLNAGETAVLKFICEPKDRVPKPTLTARVSVEPTNQVLPIKLTFAIPEEVQKLIPKDARPHQ